MVSAIPQRQYGPAYDILIVDNKELTRDTVQKILQQEGYTVDTARHGREAIEKLRASQYGYRLIITEMIMPFAGGFEVIKAAKRESRIPVLVLSAVADEETISEAFHLNADDFLKKPFMASELVQRIQRLLVRYSVPVYPVHNPAPDLKAPQPVVSGGETMIVAREVTPEKEEVPAKKTRTAPAAKTTRTTAATTGKTKASPARAKKAETKAAAPAARKTAAKTIKPVKAAPARKKEAAAPAARKTATKTVKPVKTTPVQKKEAAAKAAPSRKTVVPAKKSQPVKKKGAAASKIIIRNSLPMIRKINTVIERHRVRREEKVEKSAA